MNKYSSSLLRQLVTIFPLAFLGLCPALPFSPLNQRRKIRSNLWSHFYCKPLTHCLSFAHKITEGKRNRKKKI